MASPVPIVHAAASDEDARSAAGGRAVPWPEARRGWMIAALLALASIASQFDRVVLNLTVEPVKSHFGMDDTQFAMLQGVAFGIFYTLCSVPIGRLADKHRRTGLLGISLLLFSGFSMFSGLARNFGQLFASRVGVAVGEASVTPTGLSLLADLFPPQRLGRAVGVFFLSAPFGIGLAYLVGGQLLDGLSALHLAGEGLPLGLLPWQACFLLVSLPGLILAPVFWLLREPLRRGGGHDRAMSVGEVVAIVKERRLALTLMFAGFSMVTVVNFAYNVWMPALFGRVYGWDPAEVGLGFGLVMIVCGTSGTFFAGVLADRVAASGKVDAPLRVAAWSFLLCGVFGCLAPLMPNAWASLALIAPAMFLSCMPVPCAGTALQLIVPNRARAQVTAFYIMVISLVGIGIGPMIIGFMNDHVFTAPTDIRYSMAIVVGIASPLMWVLLLAAFKPYRKLREAAET
ncbi:MFS transporter [Novosphingobium profundi]|uniref:MFS transporter n=1 Tax=Novosphingobium profundi TaxID=1774954 RepID=UPI001BD94A88|nr:MFS transporter [Novosphingobium profundi]MBT0670202.1 MFS transporter [Novosphingobium profundi]